MTQWIERVRSHPIHATISDFAEAVKAAAAREGVDADTLGAIERLRTVGTFATQRLAALEPSLATPPSLDAMNSALRAAANELRSYVSNGNTGHVANANANADNALAHIAVLPVVHGRGDLSALGRAATDYRTSMESALQATQAKALAVEKELSRLSGRVDELTSEVAAAKQRSETFTAEVQSQFSRAQEVRAAEHAEAQKSRQEKHAATLAEYSEKMSQLLVEWTALRVRVKSETDAALLAIRDEFEADAAKTLERIEEHRVSVEKLLGVIGGLGMTAGYQKAAVAARRAKWLWQGATVISFIILIGFAWYAFIPVMGNEFSWPSFAGRALLTITVGVMAAYAAKQGDNASQMERKNQAMALELEALGPFLAPLPTDKQETFRLQVGDRSFAGQNAFSAHDGKSPATVADMAANKDLQKFILELIKSAK